MTPTCTEPYEVSARFYSALEARARSLENHARLDANRATTLTDPGHVERQQWLAAAQQIEALRYRGFLALVRTRIK